MSDLISLTCLTGNVDLVKMVLDNYLDNMDEEYTKDDLESDLKISLAIAISCKYTDIIEFLLKYNKTNSSRSFLSDSALHKLERIKLFFDNVHMSKQGITKIFDLIDYNENDFSSEDDSMSDYDLTSDSSNDDTYLTDISSDEYSTDNYSESSMKLRSLPTNINREESSVEYSSESSEEDDECNGEKSFDEYVPDKKKLNDRKRRKRKNKKRLLKLLKTDLNEESE